MELYESTCHELIEKLETKEASSEEILSSLNKRIKEADSKIKAYVRVDKSNGRTQEREGRGTGLLKGIPVSIKDNICTDGYNTECCSKILQGFKPPYDATVIRKLKETGASILPLKTNMD